MSIGNSPLASCVERASVLDHPTLISMVGFGSISVYPQQKVYTSDITEWADVPSADLQLLHVVDAIRQAPPSEAPPLSELKWLLAYQDAMLHAGDARDPLMVRLVSWPDLSEIPEAHASAVARVCALLACKPTAVMLMPRLLGLSAEVVSATVGVLLHFGYLDVPYRSQPHEESIRKMDSTAGERVASSTAERLWQRLLNRF